MKKYKSFENIPITSKIRLTEKQWLQKGYVLKKGAVGNLEWNNCYYVFKVMRYDRTQVVYNEEKAAFIIKQSNHERYIRYKENKIEKHKKELFLNKIRNEWNTIYQWKEYYGRNVKEQSKGTSGDYLNKHYHCCMFGSTYTYFHLSQTEPMEQTAQLS